MLSKQKKVAAIRDYKLHENDTGSAKVQIALLSRQIKSLADHLKKNPKDHHSRRGLLMMVGKRRRFLQYLEKQDEKGYQSLVKKMKLEA
ncbi:MAG: 30S ribosomal protein S15 [Candidatus Jorgensenbacteria bacterium GW2011_GWA2_45_13]|uniref:Small ribosomal subunit protein uS15 n=1 Tax=Candidatus Jorgensenbacteria bacterium GW2011_GWA2_45_13 TaxID=1618662 RepID=A0A0G1NFR6_9BACT|nr:MAG: 30S ribosomal protein S15 [Candidatus Jorgensenbacteria bacterium GW2011_GWA2_45_13]